MQTLYIADLPLPGDRDAGWTTGESAVSEWVEGRLGLTLTSDGRERTNTDLGTLGRSQTLAGADGSRLRVWNTRKVDPGRPLWAYDVTAWLASDRNAAQDETTLRVRLSAHALHGFVAELPSIPAAPGLVRGILEGHEVVGDGQRLGRVRVLGAADMPALVAHLTDERRRRPVLVVTPAPDAGAPAIDASRTVRRLAGLAHVVVLADRAASSALAGILGATELSVFGGAARLYWPGLKLTDHRSAHPLWLPDRLVAGGPGRFADLLFARLGRLSALTLGPPDLEVRLRREVDATQRTQAAAALGLLTAQHNEALRDLEAARAEPVASLPTEEAPGEEWFAELEKTLDELEQTATERDDLQVEVDRLEDRVRVAEANIQAMAMATAAAERQTIRADDDELDAVQEPESIRHAVELAASMSAHLEFLPEAYSSATASEFKRPQQVLDDLRALDHVAGAWASGELAGGFEGALVEAGISGFRSGISSTARNQYATDYERTYLGTTIVLGPHIARGVGAPSTIMRIYWYADHEARVLVVGHVGCKLRDDSNS